jgi:N-acetylmuramoyl-L-alanine amidase
VAIVLVAALAGGASTAATSPAKTRRVALGDGTWAVQIGAELLLEATPRRGEGLYEFARRLCGTPQAAAQIARRNHHDALRVGVRTKVPFEVLSAERRARVLQGLFPKDRPLPGRWEHEVAAPGESLWQIAEWFTGKGETFRLLRERNALQDEELRPGQRIAIPASVLVAELRARLPAVEAATAAPTAAAPTAPRPLATPGRVAEAGARAAGSAPTGASESPAFTRADEAAALREELAASSEPPGAPGAAPPGAPTLASAAREPAAAAAELAAPVSQTPPGPRAAGAEQPQVALAAAGRAHRLEYLADGEGEAAIYRLQPGEALYSSVVVRFTGRIHAEDVNALAAEIARDSGIVDVTDIPIGYPVRIAYDLLLPEFLPAGHPRRQEYEAGLAAAARFSNRITARGLAGVTVVLDAGHGGRDVGASLGGVWESLHVYDIMLRVKQLLEVATGAQVVPTTRDAGGFAVPDRDVLGFSRTHAVLTTPVYPIEDPTVGVNLRWYLANSVYRRAVGRKVDPEKVIFVSIHADSLHPSLRGAMVYIPGAHKRGGDFGKSGAVYAARKEVREQPRVRYSRDELVRSEGLSRDLAEHLIDAFRRGGLAVHPFKPVRDTVIRNRREWVPAVLRYNAIPAKVLLEVCNLANDEDRRLVQTRRYRQALAEAVVDGILRYYGHVPEDEPGAQVAAKTK